MAKEDAELRYWQTRRAGEGTLSNRHYKRFYTDHFGLDAGFYRGRRILDVGCGPRGSLEWASDASRRVGLDPLADAYRELGTDAHAMEYVAAACEAIPFPDGYFEVVCSFNSLDHVDDLDASIAELTRVLELGGLFLLLTDVNHAPTECEPTAFSWDVVERFQPALRVLRVEHYEKAADGIYQSIDAAVPYDHGDPAPRYGVLSASMVRDGSL
jgi:ubiquinone/menaquinone biosynthesis C-methylase UbiE